MPSYVTAAAVSRTRPRVFHAQVVQPERRQLNELDRLARWPKSAPVARFRASGLPDHVKVYVDPAQGLVPDPRTGKFRRVITHVAPA